MNSAKVASFISKGEFSIGMNLLRLAGRSAEPTTPIVLQYVIKKYLSLRENKRMILEISKGSSSFLIFKLSCFDEMEIGT